jgi:hypothetical protein
MAEAVATVPIPIRLAYRYPNGCMISYSARLTSRNERYMRVLVKEEFEEGIQLSAMAPFLDGLTTLRVCSVKRSKKNPGYYEVDLRFGDDGNTVSRKYGQSEEPAADKNGMGDGDSPEGTEEGDLLEGAEGGSRRRKKVTGTLPDLVTESAEKLAYELRKEPQRSIGKAMEEIPDKLRSTALLVAIAAGIHLLHEKGHVSPRGLLNNRVSEAAEEASAEAKEVANTR